MKSPILISMDSNEQGSERAKALALACGGDPTYELQGFAELPVDMRIMVPDSYFQAGPWKKMPGGACIDTKSLQCNIELKEIPDFWASKSTGHLGQQVLQMISEGQPGFVAVFGSLQEVLAGVPKVKTPAVNCDAGTHRNYEKRKKAMARSQADISTARAFCADAGACNVPVFFLSSNHLQAFPWILSLAKNILTGPNLSSWPPRFSVEPRGYGVLCSIPGIGDAAAKGLLQAYGGIAQISNEAKCNPGALAKCKVGGKALGPAKAAKIVEVLG